MKTKKISNYTLLVIVCIAFFVCLKIQHLFCLFYWDESWPYASGIFTMYDKGASLLPGAIDGELSRGHPLMFHFLGALWLNIFGKSAFALHCFALSIAVFYLSFIFYAGKKLFNEQVGLLATVLIAFQQMFFVQSSFVLLELFLSFVGFISLYFYVQKNYVLSALFLSVLFLTKESGVVLGALLVLDTVFDLYFKKIKFTPKILWLILPFVCLAAFFMAQKQINGWYVLPLYSNGLEHSWESFIIKIKSGLHLLFEDDYRFYYFILLLPLLLFKNKKKLVAAIAIIAALTCIYIIHGHYNLSTDGVILFLIFALAATYLSYFIGAALAITNQKQLKFIQLTIQFCLLFIVFSAYNLFYIDRYLLIALIPLLFVLAAILQQRSQLISPKIYPVLLTSIVVVQIFCFKNSTGIGDNRIGAYNGLKVHEETARYLEQSKFHNDTIAAGGYLPRIHLLDTNTLFLKSKTPFKYVYWEISPSSKVVIFDNIEPDNRYEDFIKNSNYKILFRTQHGEAWSEIYVRQN